MKTLVLNVSHKKTGTTFIHNHFKLNLANIPGLVVPPMKEWYLIPRVPPLAEREGAPLQYLLGQKAENAYMPNVNTQDNEFLRRLANRSLGFYMNSSEIIERVSYILGAYGSDSVIVVSDPNVLVDIVAASKACRVNLLERLGQVFNIKLFSVHRDAADFWASLLKMRFALTNKIDSIRISKKILLGFPSFLSSCKPNDFPVYSFAYVTSRPDLFMQDLLSSLDINYKLNAKFLSPQNPNPELKFDYSSIQNKISEAKNRLTCFNNPAKINNKTKVLSSTYAESLMQLYKLHKITRLHL